MVLTVGRDPEKNIFVCLGGRTCHFDIMIFNQAFKISWILLKLGTVFQKFLKIKNVSQKTSSNLGEMAVI